MVIEEILAYVAFAGLVMYFTKHEEVATRVLTWRQNLQNKKEKEKKNEEKDS